MFYEDPLNTGRYTCNYPYAGLCQGSMGLNLSNGNYTIWFGALNALGDAWNGPYNFTVSSTAMTLPGMQPDFMAWLIGELGWTF